jgi:dephospho-CoA kinase
MSDTEARQRIAAQWATDRKAARATYVIRTDGTFADTDRQVDDVLASLRASI